MRTYGGDNLDLNCQLEVFFRLISNNGTVNDYRDFYQLFWLVLNAFNR